RAEFHRTAVVAVARHDEVVVEGHLDAARSHAAVHAPAFAEAPIALHIQPRAIDLVVFVASQCSLDAVVVHIAAPALVHPVELGADRIGELPAPKIGLAAPAQPDAGKDPLEVDDTAGGSDRRARE